MAVPLPFTNHTIRLDSPELLWQLYVLFPLGPCIPRSTAKHNCNWKANPYAQYAEEYCHLLRRDGKRIQPAKELERGQALQRTGHQPGPNVLLSSRCWNHGRAHGLHLVGEAVDAHPGLGLRRRLFRGGWPRISVFNV